MPAPSIFAGMTTVQLQAALAAAQKAYVDLATGSKGVAFTYAQGDGTRSVTYAPTELANLTMLIKQLQVELGVLCRARRPMRFAF